MIFKKLELLFGLIVMAKKTGKKEKSEKHYMRLTFGMTKDFTPEIYEFLWKYLPKALHKMGFKDVDLEIERLESMNSIYTSLDFKPGEIKKMFNEFIKSHHLKKAASSNAEMDRTTVKAEVPVERLEPLLQDYNTLFDLFFTEVIIHADKELMIDMMDAFNNSCLVIGSIDKLMELKEAVSAQVKGPVEFQMVDHPTAKKISRKKLSK